MEYLLATIVLLLVIFQFWIVWIIVKTFKKILNSFGQGRAEAISFYTKINGAKQKVEHMFLKVSDSSALSIKITDKFGNDAKVDGAPAWSVTDAALGTLTVAADGMSATLQPVGPVGTFKVQVSADADLGAGVTALLGELDIELVPGDAVNLTISAQ